MKNNPYIGPRPFERRHRERFYGRDREARELQSLIISEREVLFYAQSGAGKSSLLNARVIPCLEDEGYTVLPVARVGNELPPGIEPQAVSNVFIFSTLLSLSGLEVDPKTLVRKTLADWLLETCQAELPILIFDQFEEIFTAYRERWYEAEDFFRQVRQALDIFPNLGMVFTMREDYLAAMDAYAHFFARRLRARFRMELLGVAGALSAVKQPAQAAGCRFESEAAERLIDNLRQIKAQSLAQAGETETVVLGPYIEPVQLQVVCSQLWDNLPERDQNGNTIRWAEIEQYGDIDHALTGFYESAIAAAVEQAENDNPATAVNERVVRHWFGEQMITPMDTRGLVMRGPEETAGLPNAAVQALERQHIIRADLRAGARWYELAHDRLISPIQVSNKAWDQQQEQLHLWRPIARRWQETQSDSLLYRGKELQEARQWLAGACPEDVEPEEHAFILASQAAELEHQKEQRRRKVQTVIYSLIGIIVALFAVIAYSQRMDADQASAKAKASAATAVAESTISSAARSTAVVAQATAETAQNSAMSALATSVEARKEADIQRNNARVRELVAKARNYYDHDNPELAVLLEIEALRMKPDITTSQILSNHMGVMADPAAQMQQPGEVTRSVFSPDGKLILSFGCSQYHIDGINRTCAASFVMVWQVAAQQEISRMTRVGWINGAAFSPDSQQVLAWGCDQYESNDSDTLCTSGYALAWAASTGRVVTSLKQAGEIKSAAFNQDGRMIVTAECDQTGERKGKSVCISGSARVWDAVTGQDTAHVTQAGMMSAASFSPGGEWVLSGGCNQYDLDGDMPICTYSSAMVWETVTGRTISHLKQPGDFSRATFSQDGQWALSVWCNAYSNKSKYRVCTAGSTIVWRANSGWEAARMKHGGKIDSAYLSPDGQRVVSSGCEHYNLNAGLPNCTSYSAHVLAMRNGTETVPITQEEYFETIGFSPDGQKVLSISDKKAMIWEVDSGREVASMGHAERIYTAVFSPNGQWLATSGCDQYDYNTSLCTSGSARLWQASTKEEIARMPQDGPVYSAAFSPDGNWVISSGCEKFDTTGSSPICGSSSTHVWKPGSRGEITRMTQGGKISSVAFSPDGKWVLSNGCDQSGCQSSSIMIWDAASGKQMAQLKHKFLAASAAFSSDGKKVVTTGCNKITYAGTSSTCVSSSILVWDVASGSEITRINLDEQIYDARFSPDGQWLIQRGCEQFNNANQGCASSLITINSVTTGKEMLQKQQPGFVYSIAVNANGQRVVSAGCDQYDDQMHCISGSAHVWDAATGQEVAAVTQAGAIYSAAFSPDGLSVVSNGCARYDAGANRCAAGVVRVWETNTGNDLAQMEYDGSAFNARFSPDGKKVISINSDGTIMLWNAATGQKITSMKHDASLQQFDFSPDGQWVISGGNDKTARVWETATGTEVARVTQEDIVSSVAFSPNGNWVVSGSSDGTVRVWPWRTDDLILLACQRLPRNLTHQEWNVNFPNETYRLTCPNRPQPTR